MTRPTNIGQTFPLLTASNLGGSGGLIDGTPPGSGLVPTSTGSNTWAWASNIAVITSNTSNTLLGPFVNFASGSNVAFAVASNTLTISATATGGAAAAATITSNTSNSVANLANGTDIFFGVSGTTLTISNAANKQQTIMAVFDSGSRTTALASNMYVDIPIDYGSTIDQWTMLADQTGSATVGVWKDTYGNFPPTSADTITGTAKPTMTSATKAQSGVLTGWTTTLSAGDTLRVNLDSCSTITLLTFSLRTKRT